MEEDFSSDKTKKRTFLTAAELLLQLHTLLLQLSQVCLDITQLPLDLLRRDVIRLHLIEKQKEVTVR